MSRRRILAFALLLMLGGAGGLARAHDTWFAARAPALPGPVVLALGTGNQFPRQEFPIGAEQLARSGCRQGPRGGQAVALQPVAPTPTALVLRAQPTLPAPLTCWAQLMAFDIVLEPDKIDVYLDEIHASEEVRRRWAQMAARGLPWKERYVKHARIELFGSTPATTPPAPVPMAMDILLRQAGPVRAGGPLSFEVRRDGQPVAGLAIELRGTQEAGARWLITDARGRVDEVAPEPGRWVLRGTELRPSPTEPDAWVSGFVNLAFDVLPP